MGKLVLVIGCGPIGQLAVLVVQSAGAVAIAATDVASFTLDVAKSISADHVINIIEEPEALDFFAKGMGHFDVLFECSGVAAALSNAIPALRPGAIVMQLGLGGDMNLPVQAMTTKELELRGSFRFYFEFETAVKMMQTGLINVKLSITYTFPIDDAVAAFQMASNRSQAIKEQISFPE